MLRLLKQTGGVALALTGALVFTQSTQGFKRTGFYSSDTQTSLLEVYSSEGCSSCPPAERWVSQLKFSSGLFTKFVPVVFHVDYWDYIGWKDKWASNTFTKRQRAYARALSLNSVYTPGFLLNGQEWRGWFQGFKTVPESSEKSGRLSVELSQPLELIVTYQPAKTESTKWEVEAALLGMGIVSEVKAGENKGKTLHHNFVVLNHQFEKLTSQNGVLSATLKLTPPTAKAKEYAIAV